MKNFSGILDMSILSKNKDVIFCENTILNLKYQEISSVNKQISEPFQHVFTAHIQDNLEELLDKNSEDDINEISQTITNKDIHYYIKCKINIPPYIIQLIELKCRKNVIELDCKFCFGTLQI